MQVVYFYLDMDLAILKEFVAQNPYRFTEKLPGVTVQVNATIRQLRPGTQEIAECSLKESITTLLKHYAGENNVQLKKCVVCCWPL